MPWTHRLTPVLVLALVLAVLSPPAASAAPPVGLAGAHWIWFPEGDPRVSAPAEHRYFRAEFTVPPGTVAEAALTVTADDTVDVWLNGLPLAASPREERGWRQALAVDLRSAVVPGRNTLAVAARNTGGPAGLLGRLRVVTAGGTAELATGAGWRVSRTAPEHWTQPGFTADWAAAADLGAYGSGPWREDVAAPDPAAASPLRVTGGTVEHRVEPLGVDAAKPRFGWRFESSSPQQRQGSYQLVVSDPVRPVWDTGRTHSGRQVDLAYGGPPLAPDTRHTWRVRLWDTQGRASAWSPAYSFETAPAAWTAGFIGGPSSPDLVGSSWIWHPEGDPVAGVPAQTRYFRRTVDLTAAQTTGALVVTADDAADVWVNGKPVSTSPRVADSWKNAVVLDLAGLLTAGPNTIAVRAENTSQSPAGLIAKLLVPGRTVPTDGAWRASLTGPAGWEQPGFDDRAWPQAKALVTHGAGPWGNGVRVPAPLLRKGFTVDKPVASARLATTALGLHETRLNGTRVGQDVLAPGWTDYRKRLQYKVFDVTGQVRQGANALGAWLGNGWYSGSVGIGGNQFYGTRPWYSARLLLTFTDGSTSTLTTDGSWRTTTGPVRADDLYHGETYDARAELPGWDIPGFDDRAWSPAAVRTEPAPPLVSQVDNGVTVQQEFRPTAITQPKPGTWVLDLGQNLTGWNRLAVRGPAGTTVTMRHAEVLNPDGTVYTTNLRAAQATDRFTLKGTGAVETWEPRFTVHGYRYVELTGLSEPPTAATVTGRAAWAAGGRPGTFSTSSPLVNQLQHNILWGTRSNMLSIPSDCPQRDERLGWTGDIAIFAGTSTFNLGAHNLLDKFSTDMADAQRADGAFTDVAPAVLDGAGRAGWGDAGVIVPHTLWQRYGDTGIIDEHFPAMARWVDYLRASSGPDLIRDQWTHGDWLNVNDNTAVDVLSTAFSSWSARLVARMAEATGRTEAARRYGRQAEEVAAAFTRRFVGADGTIGSNTQTGYVLALAFDLLPTDRRQAAADKLAAKVASTGGHLSVGFLGVENLLPVLVDHGHADTAYRILLQPDFPGWGYMQSRGATTIWERWDGIRPDGTFNDPGMNSFNHYGLGSVGDFLYRRVAGLAPASPGYGSLLIAPRPGGGLTSAKASYDTPYGTASSDWTQAGGVFTLRVRVPAGTSATVRLPVATGVEYPPQAVPSAPGVFHVPAGEYVFRAG
ncbi:alpha-L-rhamnosidase [Crossiella equi]|uniref:alpha-L-rhamnosidase n=1 Tax=Crossiella equi TaxID=130796 RepID=A0ABS5AS17_9PSEU|nr:family 78 glycoside hydrolase catalytic domain [Crossiella equi]MBP2479368.1 alpha-L-rhamnosidase [Crossiella equi]